MNKKEFTKSCLADSLFELLKIKDFNKITIEDIVQKSGFSRMSYYRNFSSIEEIAEYYLDIRSLEMVNRERDILSKASPRTHIIHLFNHLYNNREITEVYFKQNLFLPIKKQFDKYLTDDSVKSASRYFFTFVSGGLLNVYMKWVCNNYKETPEELADNILEMIRINMETK